MTYVDEHRAPPSNGATSFVFITDHWGYSLGGINVFNTEICSAVAKVLKGTSTRVLCAVLTATEDQRSHAEDQGVKLIELDEAGSDGSMAPHRANELVTLVKDICGGRVNWWLGHDVISGALAHRAATLIEGSRSAVFHHMNYEAYKGLSGVPSHTQRLISAQRDVLANADLVFAVGPKLARSAKDKASSKPDVKVVQVIPGFPSVQGSAHPAVFSAITFGRLTPDTDLTKQTSLAVSAFASATDIPGCPLGRDARITVVGLSADSAAEEHQALLKLACQVAGRAVPVNGIPYVDDHNALMDELRRHSVSLMLSTHEGFGLTGWEAIAAEVPLIVSRNSGLFETINDLLGGQGLGCLEVVEIRGRIGDPPFQEIDCNDVRDALLRIATNPGGAKKNAKTLKNLLSEVYTWENTARTVVCACGLGGALPAFNKGNKNADAGWQTEPPRILLPSYRTSAPEKAARALLDFGSEESKAYISEHCRETPSDPEERSRALNGIIEIALEHPTFLKDFINLMVVQCQRDVQLEIIARLQREIERGQVTMLSPTNHIRSLDARLIGLLENNHGSRYKFVHTSSLGFKDSFNIIAYERTMAISEILLGLNNPDELITLAFSGNDPYLNVPAEYAELYYLRTRRDGFKLDILRKMSKLLSNLESLAVLISDTTPAVRPKATVHFFDRMRPPFTFRTLLETGDYFFLPHPLLIPRPYGAVCLYGRSKEISEYLYDELLESASVALPLVPDELERLRRRTIDALISELRDASLGVKAIESIRHQLPVKSGTKIAFTNLLLDELIAGLQ